MTPDPFSRPRGEEKLLVTVRPNLPAKNARKKRGRESLFSFEILIIKNSRKNNGARSFSFSPPFLPVSFIGTPDIPASCLRNAFGVESRDFANRFVNEVRPGAGSKTTGLANRKANYV